MTSNADYGNPSYWDERYSYEPDISFDWYQDFEALKPYLDPFLQESNTGYEILIPGCGNSSLGASIYNEGFVNITNIDTSAVVINQMQDKYSIYEEMEFAVMDVRCMEHIPDDCFDLIIDKGLFDCQLCGQDNIKDVQLQLKELYRVCKPGGVYIVISHGGPDSRLGYLSRALRWKVEHTTIPKPDINDGLELQEETKEHYIYYCTKPMQ